MGIMSTEILHRKPTGSSLLPNAFTGAALPKTRCTCWNNWATARTPVSVF